MQEGGLRDAERLVVASTQLWGVEARFFPGTEEEKVLSMSCCAVDGGYLNYSGYRSALTGDVIPVLKPSEAVIGERHARMVFGDRNPVGVEIQGAQRGVLYHPRRDGTAKYVGNL